MISNTPSDVIMPGFYLGGILEITEKSKTTEVLTRNESDVIQGISSHFENCHEKTTEENSMASIKNTLYSKNKVYTANSLE